MTCLNFFCSVGETIYFVIYRVATCSHKCDALKLFFLAYEHCHLIGLNSVIEK